MRKNIKVLDYQISLYLQQNQIQNNNTMKKVSISFIILTILLVFSSCQKKSSEKDILSFRFVSPNVEASIEDKNIVAIMPSGTDVTNLVPVISVSDKATVNPASGEPKDFTQPVSYTVTAEDGSQAVYSATVIVKAKSSEKRILSLRFASLDLNATIDESTKEIKATVPMVTDVSALVPTITVSLGASIDPASGVATDFTQPVTYTVTAEDGSQTSYTAIVTKEMPVNPFLGVWGVEQLDYYNVDYAGNPIAVSLETFNFDPYDIDNGIQLVFREDKSGDMRDSSLDSIWVDDHYIVCPDTVIVTRYTYSFDFETSVLYMNMEYGRTFALQIVEQSTDAFVYENRYAQDYVEKAYLRRISSVPDKSKPTSYINQAQSYKYKEGSLLRR